MSLLDLMRPLWKHSNPQKRIAAIAQLGNENQSILSNLARQDPDAEVRKFALRRVQDSETLRAIMNSDERPELRQLARSRYEEDLARDLKIWNGTALNEVEASLSELQDSRLLDELARNAVSPEIRMRAAHRNPKPALLLAQALRDEDMRVSQAACEQLTREKDLQEVAAHSRHPSVRQAAAGRNKETRKESRAVAHQEMDQRKRAVLLASLRRCCESKDLVAVSAEVERLMAEAAGLQLENDADIAGMVQDYRRRLEALRAEEARAEMERQAQEGLQQKALTLLEQLEGIVNEGQVLQREGEGRHALEAFASLGVSGELARRFEQVGNRFTRQLEADQEQRTSAEQQREHRQVLLDQLRLLRDKDDVALVERQLKGLVREWEQIPAAENGDPLVQAYFALRDEIGTRIHGLSESRQKDHHVKMEKLQGLIDTVLALDENQDFREISKVLRSTYQEWKEVVGEEKYQYQGIWKEYRKATARFEELKEWESWHNERDREVLIEEAEGLSAVEPGPELITKVRQLQATWKGVGHVSQSRMQDMWERFHTACDAAMDRCRPWMEEQNASRQQNLQIKEALCAEIEAIAADPTDGWKDKAKRVQKIQEEWRNAGPVPRENNQPIWDRFRVACDAFYTRHKEYLRKEDGERQTNLQYKVELCEQAEALSDSTDWTGTTQRLKRLQDQWKNSGPVPKSQSELIWQRFRVACDAFFDQKRKHYEELDAGKSTNLQLKMEICDRMADPGIDPTSAAAVAQFEALTQEWHQAGMVPKDQVEQAWERFNEVVDAFEQRRAESDPHMSEELQKRLEAKRVMVSRVIELCENPGSIQSSEAVKGLQDEWRKIGRAGAGEAEVYAEFRKACDEFFARRRDQFEIQEQARKNNLTRKELLCEQAERLLAGNPDHGALEEVKHLRRLWKEVGPVPREHSETIWQRFNSACDSVFTAVRGEEPQTSTQR